MKNVKRLPQFFLSIFLTNIPLPFINFILDDIIGPTWDMIDFLTGRREKIIPPFRLRRKTSPYISSCSYKRYGEEFFSYFKDLCFLKKNAKVLDIGCGCGAMVLPLIKYLNENGSYDGIDINKELITWCRRNIFSSYPNFHFQVVDIYNGKYNPKGKYLASDFKLPYKDKSFDFAFLSSVFTHMLPKDVENYLHEISRVLKKGGQCLITYFLINPSSLNLMNKKLSSLNFQHNFKNYRTNHTPKNIDTYEDSVAYDENYIKRLYKKYNLCIQNPIYYGAWSGRKKFLSCQDIIIASR